jgi:16S rRNA (guanine966-N2)-methyltransferase
MKSRVATPSRPAAKSPAASRVAARGAGEIRIIGGQWRRTRLPVLDRPGLRPTPDRVRETLFNWLGQSLEGWRCADVFAGTGALGLEAASRGAAQVVLCEQDRALTQQLQQHLTKLHAQQVQVVSGDGLHWLRQQAGAQWDLVFLDPPFAAEWFESAVQAASQAIAAQGLVYLEAPRAWDDATLATWGLKVHRYLHAGAVHAHLLARV